MNEYEDMMGRNPWDRLEDETTTAFEAFVVYRDALVIDGNRTFRGVAQKLHKSHQILTRWAKKYNWKERVSAWDSYLDKTRKQTWIEEAVEKASVEQYKTAVALRSLGLSELKKLIEKIEDQTDPELNPYLILQTLEKSIKLERLVLGMDNSDANSDIIDFEAAILELPLKENLSEKENNPPAGVSNEVPSM